MPVNSTLEICIDHKQCLTEGIRTNLPFIMVKVALRLCKVCEFPERVRNWSLDLDFDHATNYELYMDEYWTMNRCYLTSVHDAVRELLVGRAMKEVYVKVCEACERWDCWAKAQNPRDRLWMGLFRAVEYGYVGRWAECQGGGGGSGEEEM
ncbi:hypothetical protein EK21DRAFT_107758 [Setomelanomma holmii]|uniref:Uncharacterized protein n=1 Tax=Setomelanomma holmii TaxID=210430 RepID=A0A9P4HHD9_9PLEO|nr:hypothetical protein EK21DRAFT_107758 [Setomelanomma holmii]